MYGKISLLVLRVFLDEPVHLGERRGDALLVGVVEREAHAEDDAALEALAGVGLEAHGIVVPPRWNRNAVMRSTSRPSICLRSVTDPFPMCSTLTTTAARPGHLTRRRTEKISPPCLQIQRRPLARVSPWAMVLVAIKAEGALLADEVERAAEEVGDEVGVAVAFSVDLASTSWDSPSRRCPPPASSCRPNGGLPTIASNPGAFSLRGVPPRAPG